MKIQKTMNMYGIDAPLVVRNLFLFSVVAFVLFIFSFKINTALWFWIVILYTGFTGLTLLLSACWMLYSSLIIKPALITHLTSQLNIQGKETVLDLGCGRGIFLIEIAKSLSTGKVHGIDTWRKQDQLGNEIAKTIRNLSAENLTSKTEIQTGDICFLPYKDESFDIVVSSLTFHNIQEDRKREHAYKEMFRVLKPKGLFIIFDIFNKKQMLNTLKTNSAIILENYTLYKYFPFATVIKGKKT